MAGGTKTAGMVLEQNTYTLCGSRFHFIEPLLLPLFVAADEPPSNSSSNSAPLLLLPIRSRESSLLQEHTPPWQLPREGSAALALLVTLKTASNIRPLSISAVSSCRFGIVRWGEVVQGGRGLLQYADRPLA
jgi:hypothetical protein